MPCIEYCRFNSFCCAANCRSKHHRPIQERELMFKIVNETPEIANYKEENDGSRVMYCKHGLRCIKKNCPFIHIIDRDGRKILKKKFDKVMKSIK